MSGYTKTSLFSKILRISADKRLEGQGGDRTTNFVVDLGSNLQRCKRLSIQSVNFPNNFYNVFYNSFNGQRNNQASYTKSGTTYTFTITPGFYNAAQLMSEIITAFNALGQATITAFTQDPITQLTSFTWNSSNATTVSLLLGSATQPTPFSLLGFANSTVLAGAAPSTVNATNLPSLAGLTEAYIVSSALAPSNSFDEKGQLSNTLVCIPITTSFGQLNAFDCKAQPQALARERHFPAA